MTLRVETSTTETTEHFCPYFKKKQQLKRLKNTVTFMFHVKIILYEYRCSVNPYVLRRCQIQTGTNLNTVPDREQSILALLSSD